MSRGSQNIKGLKVEHWPCRKSDVEIKHPIKLSEAAKCNNTAAVPRSSKDEKIDRKTDRQTDTGHTNTALLVDLAVQKSTALQLTSVTVQSVQSDPISFRPDRGNFP